MRLSRKSAQMDAIKSKMINKPALNFGGVNEWRQRAGDDGLLPLSDSTPTG
jgi:hypothetical protein